MSAVALGIRYAKVRSPDTIWTKFRAQVDADGTLTLVDPRDNARVVSVGPVELTKAGRSFWNAEVGGELWTIEDLGCGCRDRVRIDPA